MSQNKTVLHHLRTKGTITPMLAFRKYGITRLSARILDLRDKGINIKTILHESNLPGRAGDWAEYRIEGEG